MSGQKTITRRRFIGLVGGAAGAAALGCCSLTVLGTWQPTVELRRSSCGGDGGGGVLVAYASKAGSTGEVAEAIGQVLCESGVAVDVRPIGEAGDPGAYSAVVVGSAIRMARLLPEAVQFVEAHRQALGRVPTACFICCGRLAEDTEENRREASSWVDPVRQVVQPVDVGLFAGKIDFSKLSFLDRTIAQMVGSTEGDWRDWEAIRAWAGELRPVLLGT